MASPQMQKETKKEIGIDDFTLEAQAPVGQITTEQLIEREAKVEQGVTRKLESRIVESLDKQVDEIMSDLETLPSNSEGMKELQNTLTKLGDMEVKKSSDMSNRMLTRPMRGLRATGADGDKVATGLKNLRFKLEKLDPSKRDKLFSKNTFLGIKLPWADKIDSYFQEYKSSEEQLNAILKSLVNGKDELLMDNATIEEEREQMKNLMISMEQYAYIMKQLVNKINEKLPQIEIEDTEKAENIKQEILFPVQQKRQDILTHLAVSMQGYLALEVIKNNNKELIRGVDRASTTTVSALRTAVMVSEALGTQKLVLNQINEVNALTNNMIEATSLALKQQGAEIHKQASESAINAVTLENAFQNIFQAMDEIDNFKSQALPNMEKTIQSLESSVEKAKNYLSSRRSNQINDFAKEIMDETPEEPKVDDGVVQVKRPKNKM